MYASSQTDRRSVAWSVVGAAIPFLFLAGLYWEFVVDDAYITFRYAVHFANGVGLVYNPTTIVDGYTSFLWTVLLGCAVCAFGEANIVLITKILATALSVLALSYVCLLARSAPLHQPLWIAAVLTAASPAFVISAADGLETPLYIAVQMVFVARWLRDLQDSLLSVPLGIWAALLALVRPDGLLLVVLSVLLFLWLSSRESKSLARLLPFAVAFSVIYLPYFAWHWLYYGYPFPNTFYAKMGGQWELFVQGVDRLLKWQQEMGSIVSLIILLSEVAPPADFKGLTPIDQALYEAVIRRQEYALHSVCQFNERYYLWVMAHQRGRWMQRPSD